MKTSTDQAGITVIIPSYNRAHLLRKIIPSYVQDRVVRIVIVDDASVDNTSEVVAELQKDIPIITYVRHETNRHQPAANNTGIGHVTTEWIYFGDDDSVLMPGSIDVLYETAMAHNADIVGAKAIYMDNADPDPETCVARYDVALPDGKFFSDIHTLTANFSYSSSVPSEQVFVQASALVRSSYAREIRFDSAYQGNAYREETDFFVRCHLAGAKIMYDSRAVQVNLPRGQASGGAHAGGRLRWYRSAIRNNWYFLTKNWSNLQVRYPDLSSKYIMQARFIGSMVCAGTRNLLRMMMTKSHK